MASREYSDTILGNAILKLLPLNGVKKLARHTVRSTALLSIFIANCTGLLLLNIYRIPLDTNAYMGCKNIDGVNVFYS
jgi:hypothetical protein